MDKAISAVFKYLKYKVSVNSIRQAMLKKGWSEDQIFLAIKAGQNLYNACVIQEAELAKRPPPFGRRQ